MAAATRGVDRDINDSGRRRRRRLPIIPILLLLIVVGAIVAVFVFDVFNIRDEFIIEPLRSIPLIGDFIPGEPLVENGVENGQAAEPAVDPEIAALISQIEGLQTQLNTAQALNTQYEETVQVLQGYQNVITEYRENRRLFDEMIAMQDPNAFANFFEEVEPDTAARLFSQIRQQQQVDRDFRRYAATYAEMDTGEVADVFGILLMTDANLVVEILESFNPPQRAEIFNEMEAEDVAILTILMAPQAEEPIGLFPDIPLIDAPAPEIPIPLIDSVDETEETDDIEDIEDATTEDE